MANSGFTRRNIIKALSALSLAATGRKAKGGPSDQPNVLLLMVDQSRMWRWFPDIAMLDAILPQRARLFNSGVSFDRFYANCVPCSPSRATVFTGLHAHQHWILTNSQTSVSLKTGFPTLGTFAQQLGYTTHYFGKWHLTNSADHPPTIPAWKALAPYGFDLWLPQTGFNPRDYSGAPNQGYKVDDDLVTAFSDWLTIATPTSPWFTVVSLINPHDIAFYPDDTQPLMNAMRAHGYTLDYDLTLPDNYETPEELQANKPGCQAEYLALWGQKTGSITNVEGSPSWTEMLNLYLALEAVIDVQIGRVLDALDANPEAKNNTVVIFMADHGELAGSHGLKGKACTMYEEQMNIPFIFCDFRGQLVPPAEKGTSRKQLSSTIDLAPTIVEIMGGSLSNLKYSHLQGTSLLPIVQNTAPLARRFVLTTHDAYWGPMSSPYHIVGYRDHFSKLNVYSHWSKGGKPVRNGEQRELYDMSTNQGTLELINLSGAAENEMELRTLLMTELLPNVIRKPLPEPLATVSAEAKKAYLAAPKAM